MVRKTRKRNKKQKRSRRKKYKRKSKRKMRNKKGGSYVNELKNIKRNILLNTQNIIQPYNPLTKVAIGEDVLYYLEYILNDRNSYIVTYDKIYDGKTLDSLNNKLKDIFNTLVELYQGRQCPLGYGNVCGFNAQKICDRRNIFSKIIENVDENLGIIYMERTRELPRINKDNLETLDNIYGSNNTTIGLSFHALVYVKLNNFFIGIETTVSQPHLLQFYVSDSEEELKEILKVRYNVNKFGITYDCKKDWYKVLI